MPIPNSINFAPPKGYIYLGVDVDAGKTQGTADQALERWNNWKSKTNSHPAISFSDSYSVGWLSFYLQQVAGPRNAISYVWWRPLTYSLTERKITYIDIRGIAYGFNIGGFSSDRMILENAMACAMLNQYMLFAPGPDMNTHENSWCGFNSDGTRRKWSPQDYINMFRRIVILTKGGSVNDINSRLSEYGLPPLDTNFVSELLPPPTDPNSIYINASKINFVFSPRCFRGDPDIPENQWESYYPGDEFVDWVGQSVYRTDLSIFDSINEFYTEFALHKNKSYIMSQWQLDRDDPVFVDSLLYWAQTNNLVQGIVYKNHPYPLEDFKHSIERYKSKVKDSRYLPEAYSTKDLPPWGWITNPPSGKILNGTVGIHVDSYDDNNIVRVEYYVDGKYRYTDRITPSIFWWKTSEETNGFHELGVKVFDTEGNSSNIYKTSYKLEN